MVYANDDRLLALSVSGCLAQTGAPILFRIFPPDLKQYLALSDDQVTKISALNAQLSSFQATKFVRQAQVQSEFAEWTAKENLDSLALGLRYAELEAIRREVSDRQTTTVTQIQALLTADQKAKLAVLEQALRLLSGSMQRGKSKFAESAGSVNCREHLSRICVPSGSIRHHFSAARLVLQPRSR